MARTSTTGTAGTPGNAPGHPRRDGWRSGRSAAHSTVGGLPSSRCWQRRFLRPWVRRCGCWTPALWGTGLGLSSRRPRSSGPMDGAEPPRIGRIGPPSRCRAGVQLGPLAARGNNVPFSGPRSRRQRCGMHLPPDAETAVRDRVTDRRIIGGVAGMAVPTTPTTTLE